MPIILKLVKSSFRKSYKLALREAVQAANLRTNIIIKCLHNKGVFMYTFRGQIDTVMVL